MLRNRIIQIVLGAAGSIVGVLMQHFLALPVDPTAVAVTAGVGATFAQNVSNSLL